MRLPLLVPAQRPALHEPGPTPLREADIDDIEVLRDDGLREDRARLADDLGPEVAVREVGEREQRTPAAFASSAAVVAVACRVSSARSCSSTANVASWTRTSASRAASSTEPAARVSPARTTFRPGRAGPSTCSGLTVVPSGSFADLAALQASEQRALRDAETLRGLEVEAPRARLLDERVAVGRDAVLHGERLDPVVLPRDALPGRSSTSVSS